MYVYEIKNIVINQEYCFIIFYRSFSNVHQNILYDVEIFINTKKHELNLTYRQRYLTHEYRTRTLYTQNISNYILSLFLNRLNLLLKKYLTNLIFCANVHIKIIISSR